MRPYEHFRGQAPERARPMLDEVRSFCLNLGEMVVEDVRAHRVVYGKSMTFRWFADIEPQDDQMVVKTQRSRREGPRSVAVPYDGDTAEALSQIRTAFQEIR